MAEIIKPFPSEFVSKATAKIEKELNEFKGDRYAMAVKNHVASTIKHFCAQNERFAEVVFLTKRTLSDCCAEIMKDCGNAISDIDVYRGAVRNYFPNADIEFNMSIIISGDAPSEEEMNRVTKSAKGKEKSNTDNAPKEKAVEKPKKKPAKEGTPEKAYCPVPPKKKEAEIIQLSLFEGELHDNQK